MKEFISHIKDHVKRNAKSNLEDLAFMICLFTLFSLIIFRMTNPQLHVLQLIFECEMYSVIGLLLIGFVFAGYFLYRIVWFMAELIFNILKIIFKKRTE